MKLVIKRFSALAVCLCLVLSLLPMAALAADPSSSYLALGDSITTGYAPSAEDGTAQKVDHPFAEQVAQAGDYALTNLAADGETTTTLLAKLQDSQLLAAVADADLITLTIGGNDLMNALYDYLAAAYNQADFGADDAKDKLMNADPTFLAFAAEKLAGFVQSTQAAAALSAFTQNLTAIAAAIRGANPDVALLVTTQYNPYSFLAQSEAGGQLAQTIAAAFDTGVKALNAVVTGTAEKTGAFTVVDVYTAFEEAVQAGTNPCNPSISSLDFHPNQAGHSLIVNVIEAILSDEDDPSADASIYVGDVELAGSPDEPAYAATDETGTVTLGGSEDSYNVKWDGTTLTLKDAAIAGGHEYVDASGDANSAAIYRGSAFALVLVGENTVTGPDTSSVFSNGVSAGGDLTISGSGSLAAAGGYDGISTSGGSLTIAGGEVTAQGGSGGIASYAGDLNITGGVVTVTGTGDFYDPSGNNSNVAYGIYSENNITITGGTVIAEGKGDADYITAASGIFASTGDITVTGGEVTAAATGENGNRIALWGCNDVVITGGTVAARGDYAGIYTKCALTIDGGMVTAAGENRGIYAATGDILIRGGTVSAAAASESGVSVRAYQGDVVIAPQGGMRIAVTAGADQDSAAAIDGSPFLSQTSIQSLISDKTYFCSQVVSGVSFEDVSQDDWFYDAVLYVCGKGLMDGVGDNLFAPNSTTTRAQLVTILYRMEGEPDVTGGNAFADVAADTWYTDAVTWAAAQGIVNGVTDTTFAPNNPITREQMAAILYRYAEGKGYDVTAAADLSGYTDADQIQAYAETAMAWANAEGLITGVTDTELKPAGSAVRAQIATVLMRFCEGVAG